jgi:hypothetical protein
MAKSPANHGHPWRAKDVTALSRLVRQNTPTRVIGLKLGRAEDAVYTKAS